MEETEGMGHLENASLHSDEGTCRDTYGINNSDKCRAIILSEISFSYNYMASVVALLILIKPQTRRHIL